MSATDTPNPAGASAGNDAALQAQVAELTSKLTGAEKALAEVSAKLAAAEKALAEAPKAEDIAKAEREKIAAEQKAAAEAQAKAEQEKAAAEAAAAKRAEARKKVVAEKLAGVPEGLINLPDTDDEKALTEAAEKLRGEIAKIAKLPDLGGAGAEGGTPAGQAARTGFSNVSLPEGLKKFAGM